MELPTATVEDIENDVPVDILGFAEYVPENKSERRAARLVDRTGEEFDLTLFGSDSNFGLEKGEWYVFRDAEGDVYEPNDSIGITPSYGDMAVEHLPDPPEIISDAARTRTEAAQQSAGPVTLADTTDRAVVDIETILADGVSEGAVDLSDSSHVELVCVGVGYQPGPGLPADVDVLFRTDDTPQAEYELLEAVCEWLETRAPDQVLTYGDFDPTHLKGRAQLLEETLGTGDVAARLATVFDSDQYRDVSLGVSLEAATETTPTYWDVYEHDLTPPSWRKRLRELGQWNADRPLDDPRMTNKDINTVGTRFLELATEIESPAESRDYRALRELLRHYTAGDIEPVFQLA